MALRKRAQWIRRCRHFKHFQILGRKGKGCIAVPAYAGSLAEAKMVLVTKPVQAGGQEENIELTDLKSITAFQVRELSTQISHLRALYSKLLLGFHSKIVTGNAKHERKKRNEYASQVQLRALRKGPLTSKLARASLRRFTGPV
eukprot:1160341-Pelagomonas_calceolata.AAC.8